MSPIPAGARSRLIGAVSVLRHRTLTPDLLHDPLESDLHLVLLPGTQVILLPFIQRASTDKMTALATSIADTVAGMRRVLSKEESCTVVIASSIGEHVANSLR